MGWSEFYARANHGVVDLAMGRAAGLPETTVRRRAGSDGWEDLHPGVWRLPTHTASPRATLAAALRQTRPDAVADRHTTFALHDLVSAFPTRPQLLLPHGRRHRHLDGLDVRRTRHLEDVDVEVVDGLASVTVSRALVDAARDLRTGALRRVALAAQRDGLMDLDGLQDTLDRLPFAAGRRKVGQVLADLGRDGSESGFEFTTRTRLGTAGLVPDRQQPVVTIAGRRRRIDVAWVALRVGIECQGYRDHAGARALDRDVARLNAIVAGGDWVILQLTPSVLHDQWDRFVADLCRCLRRRADALGVAHPAGADQH